MTRFASESAIIADALSSLSAEQRASVVATLLPCSEPVELIAFYGGESFGLVATVAADLEAQGRKPFLVWKRDAAGLIDGIAICERAQ